MFVKKTTKNVRKTEKNVMTHIPKIVFFHVVIVLKVIVFNSYYNYSSNTDKAFENFITIGLNKEF